ncbi:MAG: MmgE/PrpD family protein [Thermoplasmata archaeon]
MEKKTSSEVSEEIKKRVVDSLFVSYGAKDSEPLKIATKMLLPSRGKLNSRIYFSNRKASVDVATFINGCMTRFLDYNDTYLSKEALHPSDNIPPLISMGSSKDLDGESLIKSIYVSYQILGALADAVSIRDRGWDHVTYISISSAAGLAALLDLDDKKFIHTLNLAINNNISLRQTRAGELSMWKGCTAGNAARNSVFAVLLAMGGFTGPGPIFEGEMGFFKQISGEFDLDLTKERVLRTMIKNYPVEYHAMSAVESALILRKKIKGTIKRINITTFDVAYKIIVKDPEKLRPKTKETADHSLPYIIAYTLNYGEPNLESYDRKFLTDEKILSLIDKMSFKVSDEYNKMYPEYLPVKIEIITTEGNFSEECKVPKGHFRNPFSWEDLNEKGLKIIKDEDLVNSIMNAGKTLDKITINELLDVVTNVNSKK